MEYVKTLDIVMIETNQASILHLNKNTNKMAFEMLLERDNNQHLYVLNKGQFKDGDYVYWKNGSLEGIVQISNGAYPKAMYLRKIEASTDLSLKNVPLINDDFLTDYILEYNNKSIVNKVIAEMEWNMTTLATKEVVPYNLVPKVTNNTVNILIPRVTKYYVSEWARPVGLENIIRTKKLNFDNDNIQQPEIIHEFDSLEKAVDVIKNYNSNTKEIIIRL